ncbi:MAG: GNAT family N-acetyltransferase/peptidase C39 family protein [Gammaproteobacteria bacterium]|nr:GNAT family N-acetyltransferase/peptidase C39 family protein [Gammaproteobacteria bacterium]MDH5800452.1 GNAT family N-acetyltransferase/peptidase C39 family protein [Gammaproteobacteria bacterium]
MTNAKLINRRTSQKPLPTINTRLALAADIPQLLDIETECFDTDRLSRRSFQRLIKPGPHDLVVLDDGKQILGYVLNLYRSGTNLARMYSIAISTRHHGMGLANLLMAASEQTALAHHCVFLRLEVNVNNFTAIKLYEKYHYKIIDRISAYYDDGADALRMEKRLRQPVRSHASTKPYYRQTTDFTCGPAALMMGFKTVDPNYPFSRSEELQIWREATTIFMTSGHGGCSPHGLALSANQRGFKVQLYTNSHAAPFTDGVRDPEKKSVMELVHEDFLHRIDQTDIQLNISTLDDEELDKILEQGKPVIALISTWRLNRNKAPHWVYITGYDAEFFYINDPDVASSQLSETDYIHVPVTRSMFHSMARFGRKRLRCLLVLGQ